jgi:polysaccharide biosynthesis/export protein
MNQLPIAPKTLTAAAARGLVLSLGLLALSQGMVWGQSAPQNQGSPAAPPAADAAKPAVPEVPPAVDPKTYVIGNEDVLKIEVFRDSELTRTVPVRPDGKITMPILHDVQAAGLTPQRLEQHLTEGYGETIINPQVTVTVMAVNSKKYTIGGMVNRPGTFPMPVPITVFDALNNAGGFKDFAKLKDIVIMRGKDRFRFNYPDYVKGKNLDQNITLENGDTIIVN